jgi:protein-S-isoprenylcysteine O-methyltransferase Ste14
MRAWALVKTAIFTVLVPGTVGGYVPYRLTRGAVARPPADWIGYVGLLPLAFGVALYLRSAWHFAVTGLGTPAPIDPPKTLVVRGPYRLTRNPMYVAVLSVLVGETLMVRSAVLIEYALAVFAAFYAFVLLYEEPMLRSKFGTEYREYCAHVPRWIVRLSGR